MLVFVLLFIGGSAGSTTGGMKIIRTIVIFRYLICEVKRLIHPKGVFKIKIGGRTIDDEVIKSTLGFYLFYIIIFIITALIISSTGLDLVTSLSAAASAIGNIGPALGEVGPAESWGHMPSLVKWLACFCMLLGRLEIFTVVVLFNSSYWRK
jgi:trk system potassium uptake protein TrkH